MSQGDFNDAVRKFVKELITASDAQVDVALDEVLTEFGFDDARKQAIKQSFEDVRRKSQPAK